MSQQVLSITQLNEYIRGVMDRDAMLSSVAVKGEISNYKMYPSGHHYFTLKDDDSALKCVMFRGSAMKLRFRPENGAKVIAMGKVSVYPRDGAYQLYCSHLVLDGVGDLHAAFEQLKAKLAAQGLFDPQHKKPLPAFPSVIGIVTSQAGAAIHDMLRVLNRRYPLSKVVLLPVRVQGAEAPGEIASAIAYANHHRLADLLIVGRGGGSIEDLWAFNDERVAWAIYRSDIPVISAVGHEPDVTISDYVADKRAATPSNAMEIAVADREALQQNMDAALSAMAAHLDRHLKAARQHLNMLAAAPVLQSPEQYINQRKNALTLLRSRLSAAQMAATHKKRQQFVGLTAKLDAMSPLKVLSRGYAMVQKEDGSVVRSVHQTAPGDIIVASVSDGLITATITQAKENRYE